MRLRPLSLCHRGPESLLGLHFRQVCLRRACDFLVRKTATLRLSSSDMPETAPAIIGTGFVRASMIFWLSRSRQLVLRRRLRDRARLVAHLAALASKMGAAFRGAGFGEGRGGEHREYPGRRQQQSVSCIALQLTQGGLVTVLT